jgi:hypothetical protein
MKAALTMKIRCGNITVEIVNNWNLSRVFQELEQGNMRIPRFQWSYVWEQLAISISATPKKY